MSFGFSVYFGLDNTKEENVNLLNEGYKLGFTRIFTSLHIPEANYEVLKEEVKEFLKLSKDYNMDIISDISPNTFKFLEVENMDLKTLRDLGVKTIRIDFGYTEKEIAEMTKNPYGIKIQLNASTVTKEFFDRLNKYSPNYNQMDALHNFYPRIGTGISEECMIEKNELLKKYGIKPCAFVQSNNRKRSPLKDGLPTLEDHRGLGVEEAANHLIALGNKSIFIGDSLPSYSEMEGLASLDINSIKLDIEINTDNEVVIDLLKAKYTSRTDEARDAIRASESRFILKNREIEPFNTIDKKYGDITIDNKLYKRYMGELQILKTSQKFDERTNVIGKILEKDLYLLKYIKPGSAYHFKIINLNY